jgi:hypothetical protein
MDALREDIDNLARDLQFHDCLLRKVKGRLYLHTVLPKRARLSLR